MDQDCFLRKSEICMGQICGESQPNALCVRFLSRPAAQRHSRSLRWHNGSEFGQFIESEYLIRHPRLVALRREGIDVYAYTCAARDGYEAHIFRARKTKGNCTHAVVGCRTGLSGSG